MALTSKGPGARTRAMREWRLCSENAHARVCHDLTVDTLVLSHMRTEPDKVAPSAGSEGRPGMGDDLLKSRNFIYCRWGPMLSPEELVRRAQEVGVVSEVVMAPDGTSRHNRRGRTRVWLPRSLPRACSACSLPDETPRVTARARREIGGDPGGSQHGRDLPGRLLIRLPLAA